LRDSSLVVNFGKDVIEPEDFISIRLDNDENEGKTTFEAGGTAYLIVFCENDYEYESSGGVLKKIATNIPLEIEDEYVEFASVDTAYLDYFPSGSVSYSWIGRDAGSPIFDGRKVMLSSPSVAVLKCSYTTLGDRLSLSFNDEGVVVVVATSGARKASVSVHFAIEEAEPVPYRIKVVDYCSGDNIPGVSVIITTEGILVEGEVLKGGLTDGNGEVYLGMLVPGRRYDLQMACNKYLSSNSDMLNNDYFIVP
jgi:hypothetical protein